MPASAPWYQGVQVPLTFLLTDTAGNPQDAALLASVTVTVTLPDQTTDVPAVTHGGTGTYSAKYTTTQPGHHLVTWVCTDATYPGALTDSFDVLPLSENAILPFAVAKRAARVPAAVTTEDDFIREFNEATTEIIEWYCGPVLQQAVTERLPAGGLSIQLSHPPVLGLTAWTAIPPALASAGIAVPNPPSPMFPTRVFGVSYPLAQLYADPKLGVVTHTSGLPFYYGEYIWSYRAGRLVVPSCITNAARAIFRHLYGMERGGQASAVSAAAAGDEETTMTPLGFAIPNRALQMMTPEKLPAAIA
jgi:hypothetical protein